MDLFTTLRVLRRRWYAVAPVLVLAVAAGVLLPRHIPATYKATAAVLLVPPARSAGTPTNPYLNFNQSLVIAGQILADGVNQPGLATRLAAEGASASFTVSPPVSDAANPTPVLEVVVQGPDSLVVSKTINRVVGAVQATLQAQQKQAGAPAASYIRAVVVARTDNPTAVYGNQRRATAAIAVVALMLLIALAFLAEARAVRAFVRTPLPTRAVRQSRPILVGDPETPRRIARAVGAPPQ